MPMYEQHPHTDAYRMPNTDTPAVGEQLLVAAVLLATAWALAHPTVGLPALAALAALAWHRRVSRPPD